MAPHRALLPSLGILLLAAPLAGQQRAAAFPTWRPPLTATPRNEARAASPGIPGLVLAGLIGGTVGVFAGGFIGSALGGGNAICGDDACGLEEAVYGAIIGESALLPLGVHLANHRRGSYGLSLLASGAIALAGVAAVDATDDGWPLIAVPVGQLVSSILIERATGD